MSHPFKSWYDFGDVAVQEREQEVSDSDINLGDYLVEGWDKDWEDQFWEKDDEENVEVNFVVETSNDIKEDVEEHPEAAIEEEAAPMELANALDLKPMTPSAGSVSPATGPAHLRSSMPILSEQQVEGDCSQLEQSTAFSKDPSPTREQMRDIPDESSQNDDDDLPVRPAKKCKRTSIDMAGDADECDSDEIPRAARRRRPLTLSFKTPAAPKGKPRVFRIDSKLDLAPDESGSEVPPLTSDSDTDFVSPPLKSRAKARFKLSSKPRKRLASGGNKPKQTHSNTSRSGFSAPPSLEARRSLFNVKVLSQEQKNSILSEPKTSRGDFKWDYPHYLALAILEHHLGLDRKKPQDRRDGERVFSLLFPDDLALSRQKAGAKNWVDAIYNTYGAKDRSAKAHYWDLVQAAIEAPEDAKSDEYKEIRQKVFDAARQLGIRSRLPPGQTKVVDFTKKY